jgi:hypothetical protein
MQRVAIKRIGMQQSEWPAVQLRKVFVRSLDGNCEPDPLRAAENQGVDADDRAILSDQGAATVARIDCCIGLEESPWPRLPEKIPEVTLYSSPAGLPIVYSRSPWMRSAESPRVLGS